MFPINESLANAAKNMFPVNEQFANAARTNLATQLSVLNALALSAFESMEKVMDLNLNVAKVSWQDAVTTTKELLFAKDPQEFMSLTVAQAQPATAKILAYSRHLAAIMAAGETEFAHAAEEQIAETNRTVSTLVDETFKGAPAGSESAIAIMKSAIANANAGYEQLTKSTKQAVDAMEANMKTAVSEFSQEAEQAASTNGRRRARKH